MDIAYEIKSALSMKEVAEAYGFRPNRSNYIPCPFHHERTASMRIYSDLGRGFHCFGCGVGGSVIDFTMRLFDLSFPAALVRLNADFGLGLSSDKPDPKALAKLKRDRQAREQSQMLAEREFRKKSDEFRRLWWVMKTADPGSDEYAAAAKRIDYLDWWTEQNIDPREQR